MGLTEDNFRISTHTLTWSVTSQAQHIFNPGYDFNSHAHVERDSCNVIMNKISKNFNSHAHVERDLLPATLFELHLISTHTLTWSVTIYPDNSCYSDLISTHTLTWSVTAEIANVKLTDKISTHTLTWSVTTPAGGHCTERCNFNSHAHVERDVVCGRCRHQK